MATDNHADSVAPGYKPRPVFIIGAPRSGTSITTWVLGQHPNIQPMPETAWIASMGIGSYLSFLTGSGRGKFSHLSNVDYALAKFMEHVGYSIDSIVQDVFRERCRKLYGPRSTREEWLLSEKQRANPLQIRRTGKDPKTRWVDGTPLNSYYVWILGLLFPEALFVHNLRRPDQVATSLEGFAKVGAEPQTLEQGLETWIAHTDNAWHAERALGSSRVFRLEFSRIKNDPEQLFREVSRFIGEEFNPDCLIPLERQLNSSEVDGKRAQNLEILRENDTFKRAEQTYELVSGQTVPDHPDATANDVIRQRFLDYCHDRSLI